MSPYEHARQARGYLVGAASNLADGRISEGTQAMVRAQMATAHALLAQRPVEQATETTTIEPFLRGAVRDAGGGWASIIIDRDTPQYPPIGARVELRQVPSDKGGDE